MRVLAGSRRRWRAAAAACIATFVCAATAAAQGPNVRPDATFTALPGSPVAGEPVNFVSYACDPDGRLTGQAWDLDGDGAFDDAFGPSASRMYRPGMPTVALEVTDNRGATGVKTRRLNVIPGQPEYVLPRPPPVSLLSPFPIVRLAGRVRESTTRIRRLTVRAPVCSRITVKCRGRGCPRRRVRATMGRRPIRFRRLERRLGAGVRIEVLVRKKDRIGKYTRFRLRKGKAPVRIDTCLRYADSRRIPCPST